MAFLSFAKRKFSHRAAIQFGIESACGYKIVEFEVDLAQVMIIFEECNHCVSCSGREKNNYVIYSCKSFIRCIWVLDSEILVCV